MDTEQLQKIIDAIHSFVNDVSQMLNRMLQAFKSWLKDNPVFVKLMRRELQKRNGGVRSLFRQDQAVKVYRSQVTYRPVRQVARSRC
ncbi:hypothetical protein D3C74_175100 [compost metagenome]